MMLTNLRGLTVQHKNDEARVFSLPCIIQSLGDVKSFRSVMECESYAGTSNEMRENKEEKARYREGAR